MWWRSELSRLWQDKWLLSFVTWVPVMVSVLVWWIFSQGIARTLPVAVVDLEKSTYSQELVRHLDGTDTLWVAGQFDDVATARQALQGGDVYAYVVIPRRFNRDITLSTPPRVSVFYTSQYILVGKLINSAVLKAAGTFNAKLETVKNLASGAQVPKSALAQAVNVRTQITPLFNLNSNYAQFLVSAIVPAIWQIVVVVGTVMTLAMHQRLGSFSLWARSKPAAQVAKTLICYLPFYAGLGALYLIGFYGLLQWPMQGSWWVVILAQLITIVACMLLGCVFFFLTLDPARAMSFAGAFTAPGFAFMGITFPATDMTPLAQFWRSLLPISHYIEVQINQVSYAAPVSDSLQLLLPMLGYLGLALVLMMLIPRQLGPEGRL